MKKLTTSLLLAGSVLLFSGCEKTIDTPEKKPRIDVNLPMVDYKSIRSISDYKSIALEWKSIPKVESKGYYIYRSDMQKDGKKFVRVATLENKYVTHYLDKGLTENSKYAYAFAVIGNNGSESRPSQAISISTLPNLEAISLVETVSGLPRQVKVLWRPHPNPRVNEYVVERTTPTKSKWETLATVQGRYNIEYIDNDLGDNEIYKYRVKAVTFDDIVSIDSQIVTGTTKPLPKNIPSLSATTKLPRMIKLNWKKSPTKDVVSYNIYKSSTVDGSFSKIASAPAAHNVFEENIVEDGKIYFYKITAVDKDGLESLLKDNKPVMGATLERPRMPQITLSQINNETVILNWVAGDDRAVSYNVFKVTQDGWASSEAKKIPGVVDLRFEDPDIVRGVVYKYSIQAVDEHGLVSEKTKESSMELHPLPKKVENK